MINTMHHRLHTSILMNIRKCELASRQFLID
jgi:hypothetical protein